MPRNHLGGASTLRNRNRVTNKTRLRIIEGNIEGDSFDTDDIITSNLNTAGVDAEDANEHHLQAVLSAASQRQAHTHRSTRGAAEKANEAPAAYIPVPDSTGVVDNYEEFYPPSKWTDPATYIRSSETVDEACDNSLFSNFTYFMDERDNEWLDKNNEEARGEGTSAQGAVLSGTTTRSGLIQRSAKAKGKEPEVAQAIAMSEAEFELIMGLFEKATHEKTEFLHHGLEQGMAFPPFSDYQDTFSAPLPPSTFATFTVPAWVPTATQLLRLARVIYPHWRERRIERNGHRIIPTLNYDETDTLNESYVCFRRREIKAVRKTRASQAASSEKLINLQAALQSSLDLANSVVHREKLKKESAQQSQAVWEDRGKLVELKRKFPSLGVKEDDELLHDKERVLKKPKTEASASARLPGLKLRTRESGDLGSPIIPVDPPVRPKERLAAIQSAIEKELQRQKERDHHWDDQVDNLYQPFPVPFSQRLFKWVPSPSTPSSSIVYNDDDHIVESRALRVRLGRLGRRWVDRRQCPPTLSEQDPSRGRALRRQSRSTDDADSSSPQQEESYRRLLSRWKYDLDDEPPVGPEGPDEQDRLLVDDYDVKYIRHNMTLLQEQDHASLSTDPTILVTLPDGRQQAIIPFRQPTLIRAPPLPRPLGVPPQASSHPGTIALSLPIQPVQNGTPISMMKKMQPPSTLPQMRISSNGGMRPPGQPVSTMQSVASLHSSPPQIPIAQPVNGVNGHGSSDAPETDTKPVIPVSSPMSNGQASNQPDGNSIPGNISNQGSSPVQPKSQNQPHAITMPNGYHLPSTNGFTVMPNGSPYVHPNGQHNGLSIQQMQNLKSAFAGMPPGTDINAMHPSGGRTLPASYMGHVIANGTNFNMPISAGPNMNLKLPPNRQMQWAAVASPLQRPMSVGNVESSVVNGSMSPSPSLGHSVPVRTPSANGTRRGGSASVNHGIGQGSAGQLASHSMSISPHLQHSPSPMPSSLSQTHSSPPRPMTSPSLQQQQIVGNVQGY